MKVLNIGSGERFMVNALNVDPNMHKEDIPKGIRHTWACIGAADERDRFKEKDFDLIFFSYSLRYNDNMPALAKRLKEIASDEAIIEIIDYLSVIDYVRKDDDDVSPEKWHDTYIKPLEDVGFKVTDRMEGIRGPGRGPQIREVFYRLCTCSRGDVQY
jgi:hypothetical protein